MVFVIDENKKPLDMCHPAKARKLLKSGKAAVYRRHPFTIILKRTAEGAAGGYRLKIDYGSRHTGLALLKGEEVTWLAVLHHRTDIKKNMDQRRGYRRRRRSKNLRYRKPRFDNRTRSNGWLPPSLQSRADNIRVWAGRLQSVCPITAISYENVRFDTQLMQDENIHGIEYQQGELFGYEVREYLLEKFGHRCAYCGAEDVPLQIEHIVPRSRGGTNRISNLTIACERCNLAKGARTAEEYGYPQVQQQAKKPLKDAAAVTATKWAVYAALKGFGLDVECGTGGRTKFNRTRLGLPKEHYYDACCVGASTPEALFFKTADVVHITAAGRGTHQRTRTDAFGFPRLYLPRRKEFFGFQTGDMVRAVVPSGKKQGVHIGRVSCRSSGSFNIKTKHGPVQGISYRYITPIQKIDGYNYHSERRTAISPATCA